ncbi:MAG TPA: glycosyltransferase family 2 protein [bacterium]|nr:glycosyltransferase family 2 protein [bacterium]
MKSSSAAQTLTAVMCVHNDAWVLPRTLAELSRFCDHIVAFDDGSTDDGAALLRAHPLVRHVVSMDKGYHSEGIERSIALALADLTHPDWLLYIEPDEIFDEPSAAQLRTLLTLDGFKAWAVNRFQCLDDENSGDLWLEHFCLYRYLPGRVFHFDHRVHNHPCMDNVPGKWGWSSLRLKRLGPPPGEDDPFAKRGFRHAQPRFAWREDAARPLLVRETRRPSFFFSSQPQVDLLQPDYRPYRCSPVEKPDAEYWLIVAAELLGHCGTTEAAEALAKAETQPGDKLSRINHAFLSGLLHYLMGENAKAAEAWQKAIDDASWPFIAFCARMYRERMQQGERAQHDAGLFAEQELKNDYLRWFTVELARRRPEPLYLFGAGEHTQRLRDLGLLAQLPVRAIVDEHKAGERFENLPIVALAQASRERAVLLISTDRYEKAILRRFAGERPDGVRMQPLYFSDPKQSFWFDERDDGRQNK